MLSFVPSRGSCYDANSGNRPDVFLRLNRVLFVSTILVVTALSLLPAAAVPATGIGDKIEHIAAYAILAVFGMNASLRLASSLGVLVFLFALSMLLEQLQRLAPGRSNDVLDVIANVGGLVAGGLLQVSGKCAVQFLGGFMRRNSTGNEVSGESTPPAQSARPE